MRIYENKLRKIVKETIHEIFEFIEDKDRLSQIIDSWRELDKSKERDKFDDEFNAELDRNMSSYDMSSDMAHAYTMNDPLYKNVKGTTLRHRLKNDLGNSLK